MSAATARVSVSVGVAPQTAFEIFTGEIDLWWRHGVQFRHAGSRRGFIRLEPGLGGRLFESIDGAAAAHIVEVGRVTVWDPPHRLAFSWRNANYSRDESTEVEVAFTPNGSGTLVVVTHRGLTLLRPDHPARHGHADPEFIRMIGLWWGQQMTALREFASTRS